MAHPLGRTFRAKFSDKGVYSTQRIRRFRKSSVIETFSIIASLDVYAWPVVRKINFENGPRGCVIFLGIRSLGQQLLPSSFCTSGGHRCRPFSPPVLAFNFIAHRVQQSHCSSIFHRVLQLTLSRFPQVNLCTIKSPNEFIRVCTRRGSNSRN